MKVETFTSQEIVFFSLTTALPLCPTYLKVALFNKPYVYFNEQSLKLNSIQASGL